MHAAKEHSGEFFPDEHEKLGLEKQFVVYRLNILKLVIQDLSPFSILYIRPSR